MDYLTIFSSVLLAALIHASFNLSVSVLTLLSGHTLSREKSQIRLVKLLFAFTFGAIIMNILLFCAFAFFAQTIFFDGIYLFIWLVLIGLLVGTGLAVWLFYYRRSSTNKSGTEIWIPRGIAKYLNGRARKTKHSAEAFSLGLTSIISEIIFIFAPLLAATFATIQLPSHLQVVAVLLYAFISSLPTIVIACLICGGHSIAQIQVWREKNKRFFQFCSGLGLLILAGFLYASVVSPVVIGGSI